MRKLKTLALSLMMLGVFSLTAFAEKTDETADVYVTIADDKGALALTQEKITVTDIDEDGALTINDALYAAHEAKFEGGAAQGYSSSEGQWGLSLDKLWGVENGGSYGYVVNNKSAMGLTDAVKAGDYINAYIYTDLTAWSDVYCFFDVNTLAISEDAEFTLTLSANGYDADWNPVVNPVANATITLNGVATEYKTDAEGKVTLKIADAGNCVISATSESQTLVPPVCVATVSSNATADVYVTISDKGELVLTQEKVTVKDTDKDGALTINDALYAAHEAKFEGGAAVGYSSYYGSYGLSLGKLWADESGSFGYYVNNKSAWSLADVVKEGDYVNAFVYKDGTSWSDTYCFFDINTLETEEGKEITLILSANGYDANWNPIVNPVEGAMITVDGKATEYKTDKDGKVTFILAKGDYVVSAISENQILVPTVCKVAVTEKEEVVNADTTTPNTGDNMNVWMLVIICVMSAVVVTASVKRRNGYEK